MIVRALEALFRHKLLLSLPPVLITLIVAPLTLVLAPSYYETSAGIWVERPTYLSYQDDWNRYVSPAQNQGGLLSELLRTRSFQMEIASRTALAPLIGTVKGEEQIRKLFAEGFAVLPSGSRLMVVRFRARTPELSYQVLRTAVELFREKSTSDRVQQARLAISFYEARLKAAEEQYAQVSDALRRYVADKYDPATGLTVFQALRQGGLPLTAIDPELADLQRRVEIAQRDAEQARSALEQARLDISASLEGQELGYQIVDPPRLPLESTRELRKRLLIFPAAGMLVGIGLSGALLALLVAGDRSAHHEADLGEGLRVLGSLPRYRDKQVIKKARLRKQAGPNIIRRAIGYVAGATLPLPAPAEK